MTAPKRYLVDTTNDRVKIEPVEGALIIKIKPKRSRRWLEFYMPANAAQMTARLINWALEDERVGPPGHYR